VNIDIIDPCSSPEWMAFIEAHPDATVFHHPAWIRTLRAVYGHRMFAVCVKDGSGIRAGIPFADVRSRLTGNRWVSLPFSDHCQPLLDHEDPSSTDMLFGHLKSEQNPGASTISVRWAVPSSHARFRQDGFVVHTLPLPGDEAVLLATLDKRVRQRVRRAGRDGVEVRECTTWKDCEVYYGLHVLTRRRLGVPVQPLSFFRRLWKEVIEPGLGFVLVAYQNRTPIAGGVFLTFRSVLHHKYSAADIRYKGLEGPSAVLWEGIRRAIARGLGQVDFGRSARTDAGLGEFKRRWGAIECELPYSILVGQAPKNGAFEVDGIVRAVIRHSPAFVCRLTGEMFYRHFG
jgi:hypothetical protein